MSIRIPGSDGRTFLLIVLFFSTLAPGAFAQDSVAPATVEITASRIQEPTSVAPQAVTVVDSAEIASRGATTVAEAVALAPGVEVTDKGASGAQLSATIRGSTSNQVLVLVDGVRANDPLTGLADLSRLPLYNVERVEVVRGGSSSLYGGDAVGGVINIITKKSPRPLAFTIENGSYVPRSRVSGFGFSKIREGPALSDLVDSQKLAFSWGPRLGMAQTQIAGGATRAGNAYTYYDANGDARERQNAGLLSGDL